MIADMTHRERVEFAGAYRAGLSDAVAGNPYSPPLPPGILSEAYAGGWAHGMADAHIVEMAGR